MRKNIYRTAVLISLILFFLLVTGCEPNQWDLILAAPPPVKDLRVIDHTGGTIDFQFTLPEFTEETALFPDYGFELYLYYRPASESQEIYYSYWYFEESEAGTVQTPQVDFSSVLTGGSDYVFIFYVVDREYQKSEPATTNVVTW